MQEESIVTIVLFLIGQTITIWKKLTKIEQKLDNIQKHNDEQDKKINRLMRVVATELKGAVKELIG